MEQNYSFEELYERSFPGLLEDTTLAKVLAALPSISEEGPYLAGGSIRRTLQGQEPESDFDFFFRDEGQMEEFKEKLVELGAKLKYANDFNHTFTYSSEETGEIKVQLIHFEYFDSPSVLIDSFDFTICQFAYDGNRLYCGQFSLWDLARRRLAIHNLTYGVSTVRRLIKYTKQGFTACAGVLGDILERVVNDPSLVNKEIEYLD